MKIDNGRWLRLMARLGFRLKTVARVFAVLGFLGLLGCANTPEQWEAQGRRAQAARDMGGWCWSKGRYDRCETVLTKEVTR